MNMKHLSPRNAFLYKTQDCLFVASIQNACFSCSKFQTDSLTTHCINQYCSPLFKIVGKVRVNLGTRTCGC